MISSDAVTFTYKGKPATLCVMRNNGYCWGRIVCQDGTQWDVMHIHKDMYEQPDEDVLEAYIRLSRNPKCVNPAVGWL